MASFDANIERQTGRSVPQWVVEVNRAGLGRHGEIVAWLKTTHQLSHSHANQIAKRALLPIEDEGQAIARLFAGGKEGLRPISDKLLETVRAFGPDVSIAPKKANLSLRRRKQFALVQPSARTRIDLGLILGDEAAAGRLESGARFNPMFTHRVRLESADQVDAELKSWLKRAYDSAG